MSRRAAGALALLATLSAAGPPDLQGLQTSRIAAGPEAHVYADPAGRPLVEPHLAISPSDADHLLVGVIASSADMAAIDCTVLTSFDGGESWAAHELGHSSCGDPWGVILADGTAVMTVLAEPPDAPEEVHLLVYRSADGGRTWADPPISLGGGHDHQTLAVDRRDGVETIYVASARDTRRPDPERYATGVFIARSTDGGSTFESDIHYPLGMSINAMTPAVLEDGTLIVPFTDFGRRAVGGRGALDIERDWALLSSDGRHTVSAPFMITDACERSWSVMALDRSGGPHARRLYYACNDDVFENVWVHYSDDGGLAWSMPLAANSASGRNPYARTPSLAVSASGVVAASFYDGRTGMGFQREFRCQRVYFAASFDGGETWEEEVPVSSEDSCPIGPANGMAGMRFPAGGDYHGLVTLPDEGFRVLWSDSRSGVFELWTARVTVEGG